MKRGLKVKTGVRAPAFIDDKAIVDSSNAIVARFIGLPPCPNNKPGDGCWYCKQRGAK